MEDTVEYFGLNDWLNSIQEYFFAGIPEHYPFQKKLVIYRANSKVGDAWDIIQILLVIVTAILYAVTRYPLSYELSTSIFLIEVIITQLFMVDFLLNCYLQTSLIHFLIDYITIIDMLTMLPVYLILGGVSSGPVNFFRCLRIVRLMRMFRTVKYIKNLNPVRRQVVNLVITLISMIYLAGSVIQLMEADLHQLELMCSHINAYTHWKPSCSPSQLVDDETCDCKLNNCIPFYQYGDVNHEPSSIRCDTFSFYQAVYFVIVTMSTVGYGDISANTDYGRVIVIIFIIGSLIVIPSRLNELQRLLSMRSPYSKPYTKTHASDKHVIICGHVNNKLKLERFFQEFFHEDHSSASDFHCVILSSHDPTEEVRSLLANPLYDQKVSYILGSALNIDDLKKARCDIAQSMFFLTDTNADEDSTSAEDAATVLRALSVSNFNNNLSCLVQVLRPEERVILKDSDIGVILCLDEYKTALQARNAVCPGFSTIIENLFHSIESISDDDLAIVNIDWYREYLYGASLELYCMPLPKTFLVQMRYNYHRIVEGIYLKYNVILLGLTCADRSSIIFNPSRRDLDVFKHMKAMFEKFNIALVIAEDQHIANDINKQLSAPDSTVGASILRELSLAEEEFPCKREPEEGRVRSGTTGSMFPSPMLGSPVPMPMMKEEDEDDEDGDSGSGPSGHACGSDFNGSLSEGGNGLSSVVRNMGTMFSGKANPRSSTAGSPKSASAAVLMSGRSRSNSNAQAVSRADGFADDVDSDALSSDANGYTDDSDDVSGSDDDSDSSNENRKKRYIGFRKKGITDREKKGETESDTGKSEANEVQKGEINNISNVNGAKNVSKQISVDTRPHSAGEIDNKTVDSSNRNTVSSSMSALSPSRTRSGLLPASASNANSSNSNIPSPAAVAEKHRQNNSKKSNLRMKSKVKLSKRHIPTLTSSPIKLKSGLGSYQIQIGGPDANAALEMCEKGKNSRRKRPISSKKRGFVSTKSDFHTNRLEDREGFEADCDCNSEMNDKSDIDSERLLDRQEAGKEVENPPANPQSSIGSSSASGTDVTSKEEHYTANANSTKVGLSASPNSDAQSPSQSASGSDSDSDSDTNSDSSSEHQGEEFIEEDEEEDEVDSSSDEEVVDDSHLPLKLRRLPWELKVGKTSRELRNAFKISNHVVLFGCDENLPMFVSELRREAVTEDSYHPILVVAENPPIKWESIKQRFNDIYYIRGDLSNLDVFHTVNIEAAYSFVLMGVRNHRTKKVSAGTGGDTSGDSGGNVATSHKVDTEELDEESVDAVTLFTYLKLEQYIPLEVFCSVELTCTTNMAVMNATIMRKARSRMISFFLGNCGRARNSSQGRVSLSYGGGNGNNHGNNIDGNFNAERRSSQLEMGKASGSQSQPDQHDNSATGLKERLFNWFQIGGDSKIIPTTPLGAVSNVNKENTGEKDKADEPNVRGNTTPKAPLGPAPTGTPVGGALNNARRKSAFNSLPTLAGPSTDPMNVSPKSFIPPPPMVMPKRTIHINGEVGGISAPSSISKVRSQNDLLMDPNFNAAAQAAEKLHDSSMGLNLRGRNDSDADSDINRRRVSTHSLNSDTTLGPSGVVTADYQRENQLWDALTTHHMLPVFAAAKAFVPTSFESLLVQSFFLSLTPVICEKLVCGQIDQITMLIDVPPQLVGRVFLHLFRLFMNHKVLCIGLYRAPGVNGSHNGSLLPYVFLSPQGDTILYPGDRVYVYGTAKCVRNATKAGSIPR